MLEQEHAHGLHVLNIERGIQVTNSHAVSKATNKNADTRPGALRPDEERYFVANLVNISDTTSPCAVDHRHSGTPETAAHHIQTSDVMIENATACSLGVSTLADTVGKNGSDGMTFPDRSEQGISAWMFDLFGEDVQHDAIVSTDLKLQGFARETDQEQAAVASMQSHDAHIEEDQGTAAMANDQQHVSSGAKRELEEDANEGLRRSHRKSIKIKHKGMSSVAVMLWD